VNTGGSGSGTSVLADWDDLDAAVLAAVGPNETALLAWSKDELEQVFLLRTIRDEEGRLVARREQAAPDPVRIDLTCQIGLFGDPPAEQAILEATRRRLAELAGVDYRPIR
jgi:hypothetical protein